MVAIVANAVYLGWAADQNVRWRHLVDVSPSWCPIFAVLRLPTESEQLDTGHLFS